MPSESGNQQTAGARSLGELVDVLREYIPQAFSVFDVRDGSLLQAGEILGEDAFRTVLPPETTGDNKVCVLSCGGPLVCLMIPLGAAGHRNAAAVGLFRTREIAADDGLDAIAKCWAIDPTALGTWVGRQPLFSCEALDCLGRLAQEKLVADRRIAQIDHQAEMLGEKIGESYEEISLLYQIIENVRNVSGLDEMARFVLDWTVCLMPAEQAIVEIFDRDSGEATAPSTFLSKGQSHLDDESFKKLIAFAKPDIDGPPLVMNAASSETHAWPFPAVKEFIIVPLCADQENAGWLAAVNHAEGGWLGTHQARLLSTVATVMGMRVMMNDLSELRQVAESSSSIKSRVLNNLSHEIRTPLNGILSFSGLMLDDVSEDDIESRDGLETIHQCAEQLLEVTDDLFEMLELDATGVCVERIDCRLNDIFTGVVSKLERRAAEKGLDLIATGVTEQLGVIHSDPRRLMQMLTILVRNSIKFTDHGGVHIESNIIPAEGGHRLQIKVVDTGVGIPADRLHSIFDPFVQADSSATRSHGGVGLGLAICRRIAESLGATLTAANRSSGGSAFTAELGPESFSMSAPSLADAQIAGGGLDVAVETD